MRSLGTIRKKSAVRGSPNDSYTRDFRRGSRYLMMGNFAYFVFLLAAYHQVANAADFYQIVIDPSQTSNSTIMHGDQPVYCEPYNITGIQWSHDGRYLTMGVSSGEEGSTECPPAGAVQFFDMNASPKPQLTEQFCLNDSWVQRFSVSHNGTLLAIGDSSNTVRLYDRNSPNEPKYTLSDAKDRILDLAFSHNDRWLAVASQSGQMIIYHTGNLSRINRLIKEEREVKSFSFNKDDTFLAVSAGENDYPCIHIYYLSNRDAKTTLCHSFDVIRESFPQANITVEADPCQDGAHIDIGRAPIYSPAHICSIASLSFSPTMDILAISRYWSISIYNISSPSYEAVGGMYCAATEPINSLSFDYTGTRLAAGYDGQNKVGVVNPVHPRCLKSLEVTSDRAIHVAYSPVDKRLAVATDDGRAIIFFTTPSHPETTSPGTVDQDQTRTEGSKVNTGAAVGGSIAGIVFTGICVAIAVATYMKYKQTSANSGHESHELLQ